MARANRTSTNQHQPEHQPEHQPQGPRSGPLGGECITVQPPTTAADPTAADPTAADPTAAAAPPSLLEILAKLAPPPAKASKASKTSKGSGPVGFGVSLTEPQLAALRLQQDYGRRWAASNWQKYKSSPTDKQHVEEIYWNTAAYRKSGKPVDSIVAPTPKIHTPEPEDRQAAHKRQIAIASNLWAISAASLLIRRGRISVGDALLLMKAHGARFQTQAKALDALQDGLPGCEVRWADNGYLELNPAHKLIENPLVTALADRAIVDIKSAAQAQ